ncbi:MAG: Na(+)-translocating NADH-quinone reductase subunit C, partial [Planctomycetota bacterium]
AVLLKERQEMNKALDLQKKVLTISGLISEGEKITREEIQRRFAKNVRARVIDLRTGSPAEGIDPAGFDQHAAAADPERSKPAPPNAAKVRRIPNNALIYEVVRDDEIQAIILPVEGKGLWSTLYGFLALRPDVRTIDGITFYAHGETPGLGGEVDNPNWKALWKGRKAFDEKWQPRIVVKKGRAGSPEEDPYHVDGLSGATMTSRGVTHLLAFWLGDDGFGRYLERYRSERGT